MAYSFNSLLADEIRQYIEYRQGVLVNADTDMRMLKLFDQFLCKHGFGINDLTADNIVLWRSKMEGESDFRHYSRINHTKRFLNYLFVKGYKVSFLRDVKSPKSNFVPHVYSEDEIVKYFEVVDTYDIPKNPRHKLQLPFLFRLLYCCGTRLTETLMIRKRDVDLENGIIRLLVTKGENKRLLPLSSSMHKMLVSFADKCFYLMKDDDFIFVNRYGNRISKCTMEVIHHNILVMASIPSLSASGYTKRIHDWRHTFAVNSFKQMMENNIDLYTALPVLSTYLGHRNIAATEKYLRLAICLYPYLQKKYDVVIDEIFGKE